MQILDEREPVSRVQFNKMYYDSYCRIITILFYVYLLYHLSVSLVVNGKGEKYVDIRLVRFSAFFVLIVDITSRVIILTCLSSSYRILAENQN